MSDETSNGPPRPVRSLAGLALALALAPLTYRVAASALASRAARFEADRWFCRAWIAAACAVLAAALLARARRSAKPARPLSARRRAFFVLVAWALLGSALLALHGLAYRAWLARLGDDLIAAAVPSRAPAAAVPPLAPEHQRLLGWGHRPGDCPALSYAHMPRAKPPGVHRIGFFGCSFTRGSEVAPGHELPSFVARELARRGRPVEVVNFGVGAYGMHQSVLMWELLGRHHDLDDVVFQPLDYHLDRDTSFVYGERYFGPVHARYVLDGDEVRLEEPLGATPAAALATYFGLVPAWRYLRHDLRLPPAVRAILPAPAPPNPLYYRFFSPGGPEAETLESWVRLFRRVARTAKRVTVLCREPFIFALRERLKDAPNVSFLLARSTAHVAANRALYEACRGHRSALGNELVAAELVDAMFGPGAAPLDAVELTGPAPPSALADLPPIHAWDDVSFALEGQPASRVVDAEGPLALKAGQVESLLLMRISGLVGALTLPFRVRDGERARVRLETPSGTALIDMGTVRASGGVVGWLAADAGGPTSPTSDPLWPRLTPGVVKHFEVLDRGPVRLTLVLAGGEAPCTVLPISSALPAAIAGGPRLWFGELAPLRRLAACEGQHVDMRKAPASGSMFLELRKAGAAPVSIPVWEYRKVRI